MFMGMGGTRRSGLGDELTVIESPGDTIMPDYTGGSAVLYTAPDTSVLDPLSVSPLNLDTSVNYTQQTVAPATGTPGAVGTVGTGVATAPAASSSSLWTSLTNGILALVGKTIPSTTIKTTSPSGATSTYSTSTGQVTTAGIGSSITGLGTTVGITSSTMLLMGLGLAAVLLLSKQGRGQG